MLLFILKMFITAIVLCGFINVYNWFDFTDKQVEKVDGVLSFIGAFSICLTLVNIVFFILEKTL